MKRAFQIVLVFSNLVPLITGTLVALNGASFFFPGQVVATDFAAQVRVYAIWFTAVFFLCVWIARNVEISGPVNRIVFTLMPLAGASRLYTMASLGDFPPSVVAGSVIEMATIVFIPWHTFVLRSLDHTVAR